MNRELAAQAGRVYEVRCVSLLWWRQLQRVVLNTLLRRAGSPPCHRCAWPLRHEHPEPSPEQLIISTFWAPPWEILISGHGFNPKYHSESPHLGLLNWKFQGEDQGLILISTQFGKYWHKHKNNQ